tara:strand:- start:1577 stop:2080 length:504 start_codon:yes stop_codon:yes gene_type:complete
MIKKLSKLLILLLLIPNLSYSAGSSESEKKETGLKKLTSYKSALTKIKKAKKLESKGKIEKANKNYKEALKYLYKANKEKSFDPDTLNYLGFVNRKLGNYKDAEIYYLMGLEIKPDHNGINEYLGELYVVTNRTDLAKKRLEVLKNCSCDEYQELKDVIEGIKKSKY